jgi:hypothetical protein
MPSQHPSEHHKVGSSSERFGHVTRTSTSTVGYDVTAEAVLPNQQNRNMT